MSSSSADKLIFLGTGTSQGVPVIMCNCAVCTSSNQKNKRLRTSLYAHIQGVDIVIDTGPDFRQQMLANSIQNIDIILQTHEHQDHIGGLDDVRPFNFIKNQAIDLFAEKRCLQAIRREYAYIFRHNKYPGAPEIALHAITTRAFDYKHVHIEPIRVKHWNLPILGFKINNWAYITDASFIADKELKKLHNLDVLIINALQHKQHYSHFTLAQALEIIERLQPKQAYLTHISHRLNYETEQKSLPSNVFFAYDGLTVPLT
ncbi:MAG: MBL fold metallo-hydrolase [Bacteroidales bacterium]|jgi:phosphoribosyl 1,2-cyclic phosphate phosphodiesterase|nr:MBL fold metallo-hydrolase [Bacteroidales bacterium]